MDEQTLDQRLDRLQHAIKAVSAAEIAICTALEHRDRAGFAVAVKNWNEQVSLVTSQMRDIGEELELRGRLARLKERPAQPVQFRQASRPPLDNTVDHVLVVMLGGVFLFCVALAMKAINR